MALRRDTILRISERKQCCCIVVVASVRSLAIYATHFGLAEPLRRRLRHLDYLLLLLHAHRRRSTSSLGAPSTSIASSSTTSSSSSTSTSTLSCSSSSTDCRLFWLLLAALLVVLAVRREEVHGAIASSLPSSSTTKPADAPPRPHVVAAKATRSPNLYSTANLLPSSNQQFATAVLDAEDALLLPASTHHHPVWINVSGRSGTAALLRRRFGQLVTAVAVRVEHRGLDLQRDFAVETRALFWGLSTGRSSSTSLKDVAREAIDLHLQLFGEGAATLNLLS